MKGSHDPPFGGKTRCRPLGALEYGRVTPWPTL